MSESAATRQSRRTLKASYIRVKNMLRAQATKANGHFLLHSADLTGDGVVCQGFCFLHTKERLAICGTIITQSIGRLEEIEDGVFSELDRTYPLPSRAWATFSNERLMTPAGYIPDRQADPVLKLLLEKREAAGRTMLAERLAEPSEAVAGTLVFEQKGFAADLFCVIDRSCITPDDVAEVIRQFRSHGEPLEIGSYWCDESEVIMVNVDGLRSVR